MKDKNIVRRLTMKIELSKNALTTKANEFLKEFYPQALQEPIAVDNSTVMKLMNKSIAYIESIYNSYEGLVPCKKSNKSYFDLESPIYQGSDQKVKDFIFIDKNTYDKYKENECYLNEILMHELVHSYYHQNTYNYDNLSREDIEDIEWQTTYLTMMILLPINSFEKKVNELIPVGTSFNSVEFLDKLPDIILDLSVFFKTSITCIITRLYEMGIYPAISCFVFKNDIISDISKDLIKDFIDDKRTKKATTDVPRTNVKVHIKADNMTERRAALSLLYQKHYVPAYCAPKEYMTPNTMFYYSSNDMLRILTDDKFADIKNALENHELIWVDSFIVKNSKKNIIFDPIGKPHLSDYARTHMEECCEYALTETKVLLLDDRDKIGFKKDADNLLSADYIKKFSKDFLSKDKNVSKEGFCLLEKTGIELENLLNRINGLKIVEALRLGKEYTNRKIDERIGELKKLKKSCTEKNKIKEYSDAITELNSTRINSKEIVLRTGLGEATVKSAFSLKSRIVPSITTVFLISIAMHLPSAAVEAILNCEPHGCNVKNNSDLKNYFKVYELCSWLNLSDLNDKFEINGLERMYGNNQEPKL